MIQRYKTRRVVSNLKLNNKKTVDENIEHNQCDSGDNDDYTAHIREIAEKEKTRFKNVTMTANFKH